jgi:hypothetical protein
MRNIEGMDNGRLVENLIEYVSSGRETLIIDESHRDLTDPVQYAGRTISAIHSGTKVLILVILSIVFVITEIPVTPYLVMSGRKLVERIRSKEEEREGSFSRVKERLKREHPDWNEKIVDRLFKDIEGKK